MSFDVFLLRFQNGDTSEISREPVRDVLSRSNYEGPDEFGFYIVSFADGTVVEFSARALDSDEPFTSCAFHIRGFGDDLMTFMLDIARAGDMVMIPAMEGNPLILVSEQQKAHVPDSVLEGLQPIVVGSPAKLSAILTGGYEGWSAFRDQALASNEPLPGTQNSARENLGILIAGVLLVAVVVAYLLWRR